MRLYRKHTKRKTMKKNIFLLISLFAGLMVLSSCNQVEEKGQLTLGLDLVEEGLQKATGSQNYLTTALITIKREDGTMVYDKEPIELIRFGDALMTRSLKLPVGAFLLTEFMLTDSSGVVLWATPKEDSKLAGLVNNPLPQYFYIQPNEATSVSIQVIRVGNHQPEDFGYAQFNIDFVERFCLKVHYTPNCPDYERDSILRPEGSQMPYYQARIKVYVYDRLVLDEPMFPGDNKYALPLGTRHYLVMALGCDGSTILKKDFSASELTNFRCNSDFPPLKIPGEVDKDITITPEGIHEPQIRQGLFGQLTSPLDSFMDTTVNEADILVKDIHIFPYDVLDSIYTFAPIGCYISPDMLPQKPLAKVRSNSEGYFQLELRTGEYLYLVKTEEGYYIDAFVSSHRPGYIMIYPEELTHLIIALMDCSMWM
jgi:hypothetical protein